jgi:ParB-like chromosome segregation protein Spo0J
MSIIEIPLSKLVFKDELYPRTGIDDAHVRQFERAIAADINLPPIIVARGSNIIVDGVHRYHAHARRGLKKIAATIKAYKSDTELWRDAVLLNSGVGLKLGQDDSLKVVQISERFGLKEIEIAGLLRTSIAHLRQIKPRFASVADAHKKVSELRRVPLKGSVRHLSGTTITSAQWKAMGTAPGQSYLLNVNQLLSALEFDLLPSSEDHPMLWKRLFELAEMILVLKKKSAA